jgi:hypothetical protein
MPRSDALAGPLLRRVHRRLQSEASDLFSLQLAAATACRVTGHYHLEERRMHISKSEVPVKINVLGAVARQMPNFGDARGYGQMAGEYFSLAAGTDIAPLLKGLENDLCQSPHWGYLMEGEVTVTYQDGKEEVVKGGDLFYWPPGHTVRVGRDAEIILFSPQHEHGRVLDHLLTQLG